MRAFNREFNDSAEKYYDLVDQRKNCHICAELRNPSVVNETFDSNHIGS